MIKEIEKNIETLIRCGFHHVPLPDVDVSFTSENIAIWIQKNLLNEKESRIKVLEQELSALKFTIVTTIGGKVEGHPTSEINYLQRLRELVRKEKLLDK